MTQRVKDAEQFVADLERPIAGDKAGLTVTDEDLDRDAESFMAFASAMGVKPPAAAATT